MHARGSPCLPLTVTTPTSESLTNLDLRQWLLLLLVLMLARLSSLFYKSSAFDSSAFRVNMSTNGKTTDLLTFRLCSYLSAL